jgi:hypothetical protein
MRTIKMQPDEKLSRFIEDGLAAVVGMMPVLDETGSSLTGKTTGLRSSTAARPTPGP